jgi:tetratricopeptide (TPR) repeat protein
MARGLMLGRCELRRSLGFFALAFLAGLVSLDSTAQQTQVGNIVGEIRVARLGLPPRQIMVNLQNRGATINTAYADDKGRFGFYALPGGLYYIVIQDSDYAPVNEQIALNLAVSSVSYVHITLNPVSDKKTATDVSRVAGSNPNTIDLSEFTRKFPKKAVSEYDKGLKARADGNSEAAERHFQESIELAPNFYPAHNELGRSYLVKSDFGAAQREFEEAVRLNQIDAEAHLNLGNVFLLTKKYDDALRNVQEGLRRDPNSAVGQFVLGSIYERTGRFSEAEHALRQALQLDPRMSRVHLELVNLYIAQQNHSQAIAELKAFLRDFPADPLAPKARQLLNRLQGSPK